MFLYHNKTNDYIGVFTGFLDSILNKTFKFFIMCCCPTKYNLRICPEITVGNANSFIEGFLTKLINSLSHTFPRGTLKKYVRSRFPRFEPRSPTCSSLLIFEPPTLPPPPPPIPLKVRSFWLELTLSPSISIFVKLRQKKLMSTSIFV